MLARDPADRIGENDAIRHKWFTALEDPPVEPVPGSLMKSLRRRALYSELSVALLNLVASKLGSECLGRYQQLFDKYDQDMDGKLSKGEFYNLLGSQDVTLERTLSGRVVSTFAASNNRLQGQKEWQSIFRM